VEKSNVQSLHGLLQQLASLQFAHLEQVLQEQHLEHQVQMLLQ
jgi:hypothetical protein